MMFPTPRLYVFPIKPLSVNDAYVSTYGRKGRDRRLSDEAADYKRFITECLELQDFRFYDSLKMELTPEFQWLKTTWYFSFQVETLFKSVGSNGIYANDISNFFKLAEDALHSYMGIDDRQVISIKGDRVLSNFLGIRHEYIAVAVELTDDHKQIPNVLVDPILQRLSYIKTIKKVAER